MVFRVHSVDMLNYLFLALIVNFEGTVCNERRAKINWYFRCSINMATWKLSILLFINS